MLEASPVYSEFQATQSYTERPISENKTKLQLLGKLPYLMKCDLSLLLEAWHAWVKDSITQPPRKFNTQIVN